MVAGLSVSSGKLSRTHFFRVVRDEEVLVDRVKAVSMQRHKDRVNEVTKDKVSWCSSWSVCLPPEDGEQDKASGGHRTYVASRFVGLSSLNINLASRRITPRLRVWPIETPRSEFRTAVGCLGCVCCGVMISMTSMSISFRVFSLSQSAG